MKKDDEGPVLPPGVEMLAESHDMHVGHISDPAAFDLGIPGNEEGIILIFHTPDHKNALIFDGEAARKFLTGAYYLVRLLTETGFDGESEANVVSAKKKPTLH